MARLSRELQKANKMLETATRPPPPKCPDNNSNGTDEIPAIYSRSGLNNNSSVSELIASLKAGNENKAAAILTSLPDEYQQAPEGIVRAALRIPEVIVSQVAQLLRFITTSKPIYTLVDFSSRVLDTSNADNNVTDVNDLKNLAMGLTKASESSPSRAASKEAEQKLLNRTLENLVRTARNAEDWKDVNSWLGKDFFGLFKKLSKKEVFQQVVNALGSIEEPLNGNQLKFLEARYYDCADSYGVVLPGSELKEYYFEYARCNLLLKSMPNLPESIAKDAVEGNTMSAEQILDERMAWVFSNYPTDNKDGQLIRPYPYIVNDDNLWLRYTLDGLIAAVENGTISCKLTCVAELLETLDPLQNGLSKYKFFNDLVTRNVRTHHSSTPNDVEPIMEYVDRLPYSLGKLGMKTLIPLLQGNVDQLKAEQPILLAHQMINFDLQNETLWTELPKLARSLAAMTNKTAVQWKVKIDSDVYDLYGKEDNKIGILKPSEKKPGQLWVFQVKYGDDNGATFNIFLVDTAEEKYGRVHYHRGGDLQHELKARPYGNYGFKIIPSDSFDSFTLRYTDAEDPVCVVRDEDGQPLKLGACKEKEKEIATFVVQNSREKRDALLRKLFK